MIAPSSRSTSGCTRIPGHHHSLPTSPPRRLAILNSFRLSSARPVHLPRDHGLRIDLVLDWVLGTVTRIDRCRVRRTDRGHPDWRIMGVAPHRDPRLDLGSTGGGTDRPDHQRRHPRRFRFSGLNWLATKVAPWGSSSVVLRTQGRSTGSMSTLPPSRAAVAAAGPTSHGVALLVCPR